MFSVLPTGVASLILLCVMALLDHLLIFYVELLMQKDHFPFIYCVESLVYHDNYTYWATCFEKLGLDATPVMDCYNSDRGKKVNLQLIYPIFP